MTKEKATISLDSEVLEKARKQIPNLSGFIEECLKQYLGIGYNLIPTSKMHELVEGISKNQLDQALLELPEESDPEDDVRTMLYHEVSHAFLTPICQPALLTVFKMHSHVLTFCAAAAQALVAALHSCLGPWQWSPELVFP